MPVESLKIDRFRNLQPTELTFSPHLNLITGDNAAGKTSLLEALFVLARGRSFRSSQLDRLIQNGQTDFQLVARAAVGGGRTVTAGMLRSKGRFTCRIQGQPTKRLSELAALFPIQWMGGNLHTLVEDGPAYRRQFLDWGLFHVKPEYISLWKRFSKQLKQRNAALRAGGSRREIQAWDSELAEAGELLHQYREDYLNRLIAVFTELNPRFSTLDGSMKMTYLKGWRGETSYKDALDASYAGDRESRFTRLGPQRAELNFSVSGRPASEQLSRGQQKVFITALQVAQAGLLHQVTGRPSLFLLDDLGSELDPGNQRVVLELLTAIQAQVFVTAIEAPATEGLNLGPVKRFHVKHGQVAEVV